MNTIRGEVQGGFVSVKQKRQTESFPIMTENESNQIHRTHLSFKYSLQEWICIGFSSFIKTPLTFFGGEKHHLLKLHLGSRAPHKI
jgi:hypothetical protein